MKPILVATDLSARSDWAIERAAKLAALHETKLVVLHVVDDELPSRVADGMRDEAQASLREFISHLEPAGFATVEIKCKFGDHFATVINMAESVDASLVVIGKHREDAVRDLFRGSTGERVIRFGNRPVLVAKQRPIHAYRSVMIGIDFSPASAHAAEFAATIAPSASMQVVHAFHVPFKGFLHGGKSLAQLAKREQQGLEADVNAAIARFFQGLKVDIPHVERIIKEGGARDVILCAVRQKKPDLLVVGTHGRSGLGRAIIGSVAESMLSEAPCDVLAVRGRIELV